MARRRWALGRGWRGTGAAAIWTRGLLWAVCVGWPAAHACAEVTDVVVTIKPIHSLVAQVMEGVGRPVLLVDGSSSPHSFSLKPSQVRAIHGAQLLIRVSERLEPFTGKIVRSLPPRVEVVTLIDTPGLKRLPQRENSSFQRHGHEHAGAGDDGVFDSHIWLDPDNAKVIGAHLAQVLSAHYPEHAAQFSANAARLAENIDALTAELETATRPLRDKPFIVFHDAYGYFDVRFGLDAVGSITISPDVQPSAKRLTELRQKIRALGAVCVFAEPLFQPALVAAVTEATQARSGTLDPEGLGLQPGPQLYFTLMRNLAASLKACLAPAS
jgi:zinc transport system substrate-binding protein